MGRKVLEAVGSPAELMWPSWLQPVPALGSLSWGDALGLLLLLGMLWEAPEEQDCCPSTCSAEVGLYNTGFFPKLVVQTNCAHDNGSLVPNS